MSLLLLTLPATPTTGPGIGCPGVGVAGRQRIFNRAGPAGYRGGAGWGVYRSRSLARIPVL